MFYLFNGIYFAVNHIVVFNENYIQQFKSIHIVGPLKLTIHKIKTKGEGRGFCIPH